MLKKCLSISFMDLLSMSTFCEVFPFSAYKYNKGLYDKESTKGSIWVWLGGENESGQMVLKKWTYFDAYLYQTMWNHANFFFIFLPHGKHIWRIFQSYFF